MKSFAHRDCEEKKKEKGCGTSKWEISMHRTLRLIKEGRKGFTVSRHHAPGYEESNYESTAQVGLFGVEVRMRLFLKRRNPNTETTVKKRQRFEVLISHVGRLGID